MSSDRRRLDVIILMTLPCKNEKVKISPMIDRYQGPFINTTGTTGGLWLVGKVVSGIQDVRPIVFSDP